MPPKRRGRRPKISTNDVQKKYYINQIKAQFQGELANVKALKEEKISMLHQVVVLVKKRLPPEIGNMLFKDLNNNKPESDATSRGIRKRSISAEAPATKDRNKKKVHARSFSCESKFHGCTLQTPAGMSITSDFLITPKVNMNSPIGMVRYAQQGELAVSTSGSPLLVSSNAIIDTVNINVPLNDGKVVSLFPHPNFATKSIGSKLDPNIRQQLAVMADTLKSILDKGNK